MSAPSFKLSKADGAWWASGKYKSGREFRIKVGPSTKSREQAEAFAELKLEKNVQMGELGRKRWADIKAGKAKPPAPAPREPPPEPDDGDEFIAEQLAAAREHEAPPPPSPAPARDHDAIRAKLLAIGDSSVDPDQVIPPGGRRPPVDDDVDQDPVDEETGQLVSEVLAGVAVNMHTRAIARRLKRRKPPHRPGEADERMLQWEHDGIAYNLNRLIGRAVALGPTGKLLVGLSVVTAQMFLDSEPIEGAETQQSQPAPARNPAPAPAAEEPRGNANGVPTNEAAGEVEKTQLTLVPKNNPGLGTFK